MTREERAGHVLRKILGGTVVPRDVPGAPPGTHDFDLVLDGRTDAVEVTMSTDPEVLAHWRAVGAEEWPAPELQNSWMLNVTPPAPIRVLRAEVGPLLRAVEQDGIPAFGLGRSARTPEIERLHQLHVKSGAVLKDWLPPQILVSHTGAGSVGIDPVVRAVEAEAWKPDNREKLRRAIADERHFFVWIDSFASPAGGSAIGFMGIALPNGCNLPPEMDTVWVAILADDPTWEAGRRLWRFDRRSGWQMVTIDRDPMRPS